MPKRISLSFIAGTAAICLLGGAAQAQTTSAVAQMQDREGNSVGEVTLKQTPNGVLLTAKLKNLPAGTHAFHVHETGRCEPPFESAGGHYNPDGSEHGYLVEGGPHAGDMPNIQVPSQGEFTVEIFNPRISLAQDAPNTVLDEDGSAIIVHEGADDYESQPSGDAGGRIACGVIEQRG